uniref:Protogenin n=2 Tax=Cyprinus carpio TaxID=7962 RepID=A0A9J7Y3Y3_CYPCA
VSHHFFISLLPSLLYFSLFLSVSAGVTSFSELFFIKEPHDVTVLRRDAVILDCQAHGEAPIGIRWLKNGATLTESERVYLLTNGSLFISEVDSRKDKSDEGFYQCLAQNKYGSILSQRARLTIASLSSFTQQPASITVMEGSVARFTCKITATPPPIITWEFNRVTLPLATERITVLPSGVLQIQGVEQADAGSYRCVAINIASRRRSAEAELTVTTAPSPRVPQRPRIIAGPQNLTVTLHSTALLECMATGNPRPLISWSRADHKSIDVHKTKVLGNGNLLISDVKPQHAGIYFCRATTPGTRNYTIAAANITVLAAPSLVEWPESVTRPRAGTARFVCVAEGFPTPQITWLKNGEPVHSNGRIKMYNSKLVINQIIPEDDGIYQCQAENEQGSVLAMARLIVVMSDNRPSAPRNVRADTVSSSAILLAWERPMYNSDKVIAYSVHYMKAEGLNNEEYQIVIGNDTTRYIIDDLEAGRNYTFYIVAYMPMGASRMSDHVIQHTLEDVPLRAPELSLTSRSPSDIQVSWQPLSHKLSRGRVSGYRLSYRTSTDGAVTQLELSRHKTHHLLEGLQPDTTYLLRITAATSVGWGEPSAWTSHRTPKASSTKVPLAPELQLESLNCTTVVLRWHLPSGSATGLQGYKLSYHEESEQKQIINLIVFFLFLYFFIVDPRKKYHVKLLAYSLMGEGYQADQTISTPGCVSVRDRLVPPPPPPHHIYARSNSSSSVFLHWARPAFTGGQTVNYTVRCNPVGLQNASLVLYLQTLMVTDLDPNTNYEFAVRLHVDQLSSPWSPVVYQNTLPEAPTRAPVGVKVTLIEGGTALVSWKPPDELNIAVTRYTILYASRRAWAAGEWLILQREGSVTMALLENLQSGQVYLVKVSASNQMGDGPFSPAVELTVATDGHAPRAHGSLIECFHDESMTDLQAGGQTPPTAVRLANQSQAESVEVMMPMMRDHFIDAKGGTNLIINSYGPVKPTTEKKKRKRWNFFKRDKKDVKRVSSPSYSYHHGTTLLCYTETSPQHPPSSLHGLFGPPGGDSEGSHSSEGSYETGDSGRYSHDDTEATNLSLGAGSRPASLQGEESEASDETPVHECTEKELHPHVILMTETTLQKQEMMEPHPV